MITSLRQSIPKKNIVYIYVCFPVVISTFTTHDILKYIPRTVSVGFGDSVLAH